MPKLVVTVSKFLLFQLAWLLVLAVSYGLIHIMPLEELHFLLTSTVNLSALNSIILFCLFSYNTYTHIRHGRAEHSPLTTGFFLVCNIFYIYTLLFMTMPKA